MTESEPLFSVVELDAASPLDVIQAITEKHADGMDLIQSMMCMDDDLARYYTLVFARRPSFTFAQNIRSPEEVEQIFSDAVEHVPPEPGSYREAHQRLHRTFLNQGRTLLRDIGVRLDA